MFGSAPTGLQKKQNKCEQETTKRTRVYTTHQRVTHYLRYQGPLPDYPNRLPLPLDRGNDVEDTSGWSRFLLWVKYATGWNSVGAPFLTTKRKRENEIKIEKMSGCPLVHVRGKNSNLNLSILHREFLYAHTPGKAYKSRLLFALPWASIVNPSRATCRGFLPLWSRLLMSASEWTTKIQNDVILHSVRSIPPCITITTCPITSSR